MLLARMQKRRSQLQAYSMDSFRRFSDVQRSRGGQGIEALMCLELPALCELLRVDEATAAAAAAAADSSRPVRGRPARDSSIAALADMLWTDVSTAAATEAAAGVAASFIVPDFMGGLYQSGIVSVLE
jgi:hypothetical protein